MIWNNKIKGSKFYGLVRKDGTGLVCVNKNIKDTIRAMDHEWPVLVEFHITKTFTRNDELKEVDL